MKEARRMDTTVENGKITGTMLGTEDHGIWRICAGRRRNAGAERANDYVPDWARAYLALSPRPDRRGDLWHWRSITLRRREGKEGRKNGV